MNKINQYTSDGIEMSPKFTTLFPNGFPDSLKAISYNLATSDISDLTGTQLQTKEAFSKKWSFNK